MSPNRWNAFWDPRGGGDADWLRRFLGDNEEDPRLTDRYVRKYEFLDLKPGESVLDLGCGAGSDVMRMAPLVGPSGSVVGVDMNPQMADATATRASAAGFTNVTTHVTDGTQLDYPDECFDAAHTERVLVYPEDPAATIRELVRVLRPGGRLVCLELDVESRFADLDDMELHDRVYQYGGGFLRNARIGRQLPRRFKTAGLEGVQVQAFATVQWGGERRPNFESILEGDINHALEKGSITEMDAERFREIHRDLIATGDLLTASLAFLVKGTKPES